MKTQIENFAVALRCGYPFKHVDNWELIAKIGGGIAIKYGILCGTSPRNTAQIRRHRMELADLLDKYAKTM